MARRPSRVSGRIFEVLSIASGASNRRRDDQGPLRGSTATTTGRLGDARGRSPGHRLGRVARGWSAVPGILPSSVRPARRSTRSPPPVPSAT